MSEKTRIYLRNGEFTSRSPVASFNPTCRACAVQIEGQTKKEEKEEDHGFGSHSRKEAQSFFSRKCESTFSKTGNYSTDFI